MFFGQNAPCRHDFGIMSELYEVLAMMHSVMKINSCDIYKHKYSIQTPVYWIILMSSLWIQTRLENIQICIAPELQYYKSLGRVKYSMNTLCGRRYMCPVERLHIFSDCIFSAPHKEVCFILGTCTQSLTLAIFSVTRWKT